MKSLGIVVLFHFILFQTTLEYTHAQYVPRNEFGSTSARRRGNIDTNNVQTSLHNFDLFGRTGVGEGNVMEWPKGTSRTYIGLCGVFVGGEVVDANGDTIHIVSVPAYRYNQANGSTWNFEPVPQYLNSGSSQIACSNDPGSWPPVWFDRMSDSTDPGWPGSWNGLLGKNVFVNGTEYYYHYSDNLYDRYNFYPDSAHLARRGLGIVVSERVLEFKDPILSDALLVVADIHNVGRHGINKAAVTFWAADFIGGDGDSQDDYPTYDLGHDLVYFNDRDGHSSNPAFAGVRVGTPTLAFIQTPQNLGLTNLQYLPAGDINFSTTPDIYFWNTFMQPGSFVDPNSIYTGDYDAFASCGTFGISPGGSVPVITGWVFSQDSTNGRRKAQYLKSFVAGGYSTSGVAVAITAPAPGETVSGLVPIQWNAESGNPSLRADILYSSDFGDDWSVITEGGENDGSFVWDTDSLSDGIFYSILVVAYDTNRIGYSTTGQFTVNNNQPAPPQIRLDRSLAGQAYQSQIPVHWIGGDADGDTVHISLSYAISGSSVWTPIVSGLANSGSYTVDVTPLPNSAFYLLKAEVTDGSLQGCDSVGLFRVQNPRHGLSDSAFFQRTTVGTGLIQPRIVDSTQVNGHRYRVEFGIAPDSATRYNVFDENTGVTVVTDAREVSGVVEGPLFDGMRLLVRNEPLGVDTSESGWQREGVYDLQLRVFTLGWYRGIPELADYRVEIGAVGLDTSVAITLVNALPSRPVNFRVTNTVSNRRVPFAFAELNGSDGQFTAGWWLGIPRSDVIVFLKPDGQDSLIATWMLTMITDSLSGNPVAGDTLGVRLFKPFQLGDHYRFDAIAGPLLGVKGETASGFALMQNYPNPFNPSTEIRFSLEGMMPVQLEIYDILGRRVRWLLNETLTKGEYRVRWDGRNEAGYHASSGVYFYRLRAGSLSQTRKLLLLR